jgi:anti-sigma factor RsiW
MNCEHIHPLLALYAGGDLPPDQKQEVKRHLAGCSQCTERLSEYTTTLNLVHGISDEDTLPPLQEDFTVTVMNATTGKLFMKPRSGGSSTWMRWAVAACWIALFGFFWRQVSGDMAQNRSFRLDAELKQVAALVSRDRSLVTLETLSGLGVSGPYRFEEWKPSGGAGIFAILHKPDPVNDPDRFAVDFLGESSRIIYSGDTWKQQRLNRLTLRAGSVDNIYIAEYQMPEESSEYRRAVLHKLISTLNPYYN